MTVEPHHSSSANGEAHRLFLLSPANIAGARAGLVMSDSAQFDLAKRLRGQGAPLGEVFSFTSGLYFRGKLAYARTFADAPPGLPAALIITAGGGLIPAERLVTLRQLHEICSVAVDPANVRYRDPLRRDARRLAHRAGRTCRIILLGSIATPKYIEPLLEVFGDRLYFPAEFIGRGDLSRGGLMLRQVAARAQLTYVRVAEAARHGPKPPRLERLSVTKVV